MIEFKSITRLMMITAMITLFVMSSCDPGVPVEVPDHDSLVLTDNDGGDAAVLVLDSRRDSGCVNDEILRVSSTEAVGSVLSDGACNGELSVFSDDDAVVLVDSVIPAWTDPTGDSVSVDLAQDLYSIPVTIWIVSTDAAAQADYSSRATLDIARARQLYNQLNTGIAFDLDPSVDLQLISDNAGVSTVVNAANDTAATGLCEGVEPITDDSTIYDAGRINIYYANFSVFNGFECDTGFVIVMGITANNETLSHEIGHALDMDHYSASNDNIMWSSGIAGRDNFTIGQSFRMNLNPSSVLNALGVRTDVTRSCAHSTSNDTCPDITLDDATK